MISIGIGPFESFVVGAFRHSGNELLDLQRISVVTVHEGRLGAPIGGDDGQSAGHRFQNRHAPAFASRRQNKTVCGTVEAAKLIIRQIFVEDEFYPAALGIEVQTSNDLRYVDARIGAVCFAEQDHRLLGPEGPVEGFYQLFRRLPFAPLENGQEFEVLAQGELFDERVEVVGVNAQGHQMDGNFYAGISESLKIEKARHPDFVHLVAVLHPFLGQACHFQHRVADLIISNAFRLLRHEGVALAVNHAGSLRIDSPGFHDVDVVVGRRVRFLYWEDRSRAVEVAVGDRHVLSVQVQKHFLA